MVTVVLIDNNGLDVSETVAFSQRSADSSPR